jgi:hypothetical protein
VDYFLSFQFLICDIWCEVGEILNPIKDVFFFLIQNSMLHTNKTNKAIQMKITQTKLRNVKSNDDLM